MNPVGGRTEAAAATRIQRDVHEDLEQNQMSHRITRLMMPLMIRVGQARDGYIPPKCTIYDVCQANRLLMKEVGPDGRYLGSMLAAAIRKMLGEVEPKGSSIPNDVAQASHYGRSNLDCDKFYTECPNLPPANVPQFLSILKSPIGKAYTSKYSTT